jgi:hypothetical protein
LYWWIEDVSFSNRKSTRCLSFKCGLSIITVLEGTVRKRAEWENKICTTEIWQTCPQASKSILSVTSHMDSICNLHMIPWKWCFTSMVLVPNPSLQCSHQKSIRQIRAQDCLPSTWPVFLKIVTVYVNKRKRKGKVIDILTVTELQEKRWISKIRLSSMGS